jgi:quercetin dioxygenase-like cupin family protein
MTLERIAWREEGPPVEGVLMRRLHAEGFEVLRWQDRPGVAYEPHAHDHDESLWVTEGEITFGVAGSEYRLGAGDRLMLPAGTVHTARVGPTGAAYLIGQRP